MTLISSQLSDHRPATDAAVRALTGSGIPVHLPGTDPYTALTATSNLTKAIRPVAVVAARGSADVSHTLRVAAATGLQVAVQGTGHGATETMQDAILVSTAALDELTVHADARWARIGAGVRWAAVLEACAPYGLAALAGSSPHVGVVGYLTGGGLGPVARTHGLASDTVRAFDVVTGDGVAHRVTATSDPDLFWGLRGGKGTLGIVTAVEIDLVEQAELYAGAVWFAGADAAAVVRTWSRWCELLPQEGTTSIAVMRLPDLPIFPAPLRGTTSVAVRFAWTGDPATGEEMIRAIRSVATPIIDTVRVMAYAELGDVHTDPTDPMPLHEHHSLLDSFPGEAADRLLELVGPDAQCAQAVVEVRQLGGRVRDDRGVPSAFAHRDAAFSVFSAALLLPELAELVAQDTVRVHDGLAPWARDGGLPNFTDSAGPQWAGRVFTADVAQRLRALSLAHDPAGVLLGARGVRS
ncbi:FAD-binding oxidoreductase [Cellulomonas fengjieae]|uniref:FAD-binding oxidoreductase n=1 Tax=Cellulomonas fengjieae TaxID=2819978 RepID=UPI001AAEF563|nr:FAD-binding oxidoreductase [Cellulomonas fengjieae]MBO3101863.1 FAD-binding oxidoreductase [Cellulomonas fengjieae]